jgi:hypothetical protein
MQIPKTPLDLYAAEQIQKLLLGKNSKRRAEGEKFLAGFCCSECDILRKACALISYFAE